LLEKPGLRASLAVSDHPFKGSGASRRGDESGALIIDQREYLSPACGSENGEHDDQCHSTYTGSMISSARRLFRMFGPGLVTGADADVRAASPLIPKAARSSRASRNPDELRAFADH
jgi:hypothetical protein